MLKQIILSVVSYKRAEEIKNICAIILYYSGIAFLMSLFKQRGASILIFHSISEKNVFADNRISSVFFEKVIKYLSKRNQIVPLSKLIKHLQDGKTIPHNWVVLTFDDGYDDNFTNALPVLKRYRAVGTFFVTLNVIDGQKPFFYDLIQNIIDCSTTQKITLPICERIYTFSLTDQNKKDDAALRIVLALREKGHQEQLETISLLTQKCGVKKTAAIKTPSLYLSTKKVKYLHQAGMEIGSHTLSHPNLNSLSEKETYREVYESKTQLELITGTTVTSFSYPYGKPSTYNKAVTDCIKTTGYDNAVTTQFGQVTKNSDKYKLPRFGIRESQLTRMKVNLLGIKI